jgi:hypothetical protein
VSHQAIHEIIINQTQFNDEFYPHLLEWDDDLGFMRQTGSQSDKSIVVVGFCDGQPSPPEKCLLPKVITPRTTYESLTIDERSIDKQGKGIGPRLYNTPWGITGLAEHAGMVGMYSVELDSEHIRDMRKSSDFRITGKVGRIARHAGLVVQSKVMSLRSTLEDVNGNLGEDTHAVLYNQPPRAAMREKQPQEGKGVVSEFMVIRSAMLRLQKHGEVNLQGLTSKG